jgi:hypothetical protein
MINVDVRSNLDEVKAEFHRFSYGLQEKATVRALNRALDQAATETVRRIRDVYNVKARAVHAAMKKDKADGGFRLANATLKIRGARIPLIEFGARWSRRNPGATVLIKKGGGRKTLRGSFIGVHGKTGKRQVFVRLGKKRYPIKTLRSLSLPQAFVKKTVLAAVKAKAGDSFTKNFRQQVDNLLKKQG